MTPYRLFYFCKNVILLGLFVDFYIMVIIKNIILFTEILISYFIPRKHSTVFY